MIVAKHMGVKPWELLEQPGYWFWWGLTWLNAEGYAEREQMEDQKRKQIRNRRRIS